jgi:hypothetical protein
VAGRTQGGGGLKIKLVRLLTLPAATFIAGTTFADSVFAFEVDDAKCKDGEYDIKLDMDFKIILCARRPVDIGQRNYNAAPGALKLSRTAAKWDWHDNARTGQHPREQRAPRKRG